MINAMTSAIHLTHVTKTYGNVTAVDGLDLEIAEGEFFSMLGPSGSGKTTVLRLIAGFETATAGTVSLFGQDVTRTPAFDRPVNTVFQDYALFPHMSVLDNVAFGLRIRGVGRKERHARAQEALDLVQLGEYGTRKPSELSGGQKQRVALARAIVLQPRALLLDEPLGALDLQLCEQMQIELKQLQRALGITFVFVTHDQNEALTLSDRVAVFSAGKIVQIDTPEGLYEHPATRYVADFVGHSVVFEPDSARALGLGDSIYSLRPERIQLAERADAINITGVIAEIIYSGATRTVVIDAPAPHPRLTATIPNSDRAAQSLQIGDTVTASFRVDDSVPLTE